MDKQYSWKKTEDIEIDLMDLFRRLCRKWKQIMVCALVSAVILGGYGYLKGKAASFTDPLDSSEEIGLTEGEKQAVEEAVLLNHEISGLEMYLNNSVLMQLDPYHKSRFVMLYRIDNAKRQELQAITESYLNFAANGGAADALRKTGSWKMDKSCLSELISAYQKTYSFPYQTVLDETAGSSILTESFFYVEITGKDAKTAKKMALDIQDVLKEYSKEVKENAGSHRLVLTSSAESMTADSGLLSQQHDKKVLLSSNRTGLRAMTDGFSEQQMAAYEEAAMMDHEQKELPESDEDLTDDGLPDENYRWNIKYIFLGLAGGIFAYCGIFACWYIFSDKLKSMDELKRLYVFPFYGGILLKSKDAEGIEQDTGGSGKIQVLNRIRLVCKKKKLSKLCVASASVYSEKEIECLKSIAQELEQWNIEMMVMENTITNTAVWDCIEETGNVLMVCRIGKTTHQMIDDEMSFYVETGIDVIGAIAFLRND